MQRGLPDLIEGSERRVGQGPDLLPTPTSTPGTGYLSGNRRDTWRPTVALAVQGYRPSKTGKPAEPIEPVLLPTPTARAYGSNQSVSAGAAVRPSLATLATRRLLPDPNATDAPGSASTVAATAGTGPVDGARLLPTPRTSDGRGPALHGQGGVDLRTLVSRMLLPTPRASDGTKGCPAQRGSKGDLTLPSAAVRLSTPDRARGEDNVTVAGGRLLPTPRVSATRTARRAATDAGSRSGPSLEQAAEIADATLPRELGSWQEAPASWQPTTPARAWGPYAQAVNRWEQLIGRPAPTPTQPGTHGKPVLAPVFVEWLMGLDHGWVTDLPLPRTLALRVLGNGVVPQQAALALALLLCPHRWAVRP